MRALAYDRAAWSYALAGQTSKAEAALTAAATEVTRVDQPSPDWAAWVDLQEMDIMTGRCWASLGRPLRAVPALTRALDTFPDACARDKALYLLALAEAYFHAREVELATETITYAHKLTIGLASTRPRARLERALAMCAPFESARPIRDLREQLRETVQVAAATD